MPKTLPELLALMAAGEYDKMLPEKYAGCTVGKFYRKGTSYNVATDGKPEIKFGDKKEFSRPHSVCHPMLYVDVAYNTREADANVDLFADAKRLAATNALLLAAVVELYQTGKAVADRWDGPNWKDLPHTGVYIRDLRDAVTSSESLLKLMGDE